jgi:hypothetical protein
LSRFVPVGCHVSPQCWDINAEISIDANLPQRPPLQSWRDLLPALRRVVDMAIDAFGRTDSLPIG